MTASKPSIGDRMKEGAAHALIHAAVTGASRSATVRERLLRAVSDALARSYTESYGERDPDLLARQIWFGRSLKPFFLRLLAERPRAATRLAQLAYVWARDVKRRSPAERGGAVAPVTAVLEATERCNLRCPGCYADSTGKGVDLPFEVWRDVIASLRDMGLTLVSLSGGEPFLRETKERFITRMAAEFPHLGFLVYTNATLINEDVARRIGEAGNVFPAISVEGYEGESDARRGEGYSSNAARVRGRLARHHALYGFSATVTRLNADIVSSDEFIERRIAEGDMFGWYFLLQPIGRKPDPGLLVSPEQRARLREQICKWRAEGRPIFIGDFWNDGPFTNGCIAGGTAYLHIYGNGDVSPCTFSPVAVANVRDVLGGKGEYASLADLLNRHLFFIKFRRKQAEITDHRAPCPLIDHPEMFREVCKEAPWYAGSNMPEGYLDGEIARALDDLSRRWRGALEDMPPLPEAAEAQISALRGQAPGGRDGGRKRAKREEKESAHAAQA